MTRRFGGAGRSVQLIDDFTLGSGRLRCGDDQCVTQKTMQVSNSLHLLFHVQSSDVLTSLDRGVSVRHKKVWKDSGGQSTLHVIPERRGLT